MISFDAWNFKRAMSPFVAPKSDSENPLRVAARDLSGLIVRQVPYQREDARHVADVVRKVGAVEHVVGTSDIDAHRQSPGLINDSVVKDAAQIGAWLLFD